MNEILARIKAVVAEGMHPIAVSAQMIDAVDDQVVLFRVAITFQDFVSIREAEETLVDEEKLPAGVDLMGWSRYPDLTFDAMASAKDMEAMISEVADAGEAVDYAIFGSVKSGHLSFLTKPNKWMKRR